MSAQGSAAGSGVVVYGRAGCGQCFATQRVMQTCGIEFSYKDVDADPAAARQARAMAERVGQSALPLVSAGGQEWSGFRKERIEAISPPRVGRQAAGGVGRARGLAMSA